MTYSLGATSARDSHEASTRSEIARRLAAITGFAYEGEYDPVRRYATTPYFVPRDTLTSETASRIGVRKESDLFGAVVPHAFVATKTITHPLVDDRSQSPRGWCAEFPRRVADVVLEGFSAFATKDALQAGRRLLEDGTVRLKPATGLAGVGQVTVNNAVELVQALDRIDRRRNGAIRRRRRAESRTDVTTYSVGQLRVADFVGTYHGTQYLTTNNDGAEVYGGSDITVARGDFDALLNLQLPENVQLAIRQARAYDRGGGEVLRWLLRLPPQLRCCARPRRSGLSSLGRAGAIVAAGGRKWCGDRGIGGV